MDETTTSTDERTFTRQLPVPLTVEARARAGEALAKTHDEIAKLDRERKDKNTELNGLIDAQKTLGTELAKQINTGQILQAVECVEVADPFRACWRTYRTDVTPREDAMIEQRPMTEEELRRARQPQLGEKKGPTKPAELFYPLERLLAKHPHPADQPITLRVRTANHTWEVYCAAEGCTASQTVNLQALANVTRAELAQPWCPPELAQALGIELEQPKEEGAGAAAAGAGEVKSVPKAGKKDEEPSLEILRPLLTKEHNKRCKTGNIQIIEDDTVLVDHVAITCSCGARFEVHRDLVTGAQQEFAGELAEKAAAKQAKGPPKKKGSGKSKGRQKHEEPQDQAGDDDGERE